MHASRAGVDYIGTYRCSAAARRTLQVLGTQVSTPVVDWYLWNKLKPRFPDLDPLKENRSVTTAEWVEKGLAKFGCPVHRTDSDGGRSSAAQAGTPDDTRITPGDRSSGPDLPGWLCRCYGRLSRSSRSTRVHAGGSVRSTGKSLGPSGADGLCHTAGQGAPIPAAEHVGRHRRSRTYSQSAYIQAFNKTLSVLGGGERRRKPLDMDMVVAQVIHPSHFSGAPFFARNSEVIDRAVARAHRVASGDISFDPYVAGRRVQFGPSGPKTRLVWMAPLSTTLLASRFSAPIHSELERVLPLAYGYNSVEKGARISALTSKHRQVVSLDFSGFDASLSASMIKDAFAILRTHLDLDDEDEALYERIVNDFIHTRIVTPDGDMYRVHGGVPSGSPFTSLVDSVCNVLACEYAWILLTGQALEPQQMWVLGDDVIIGVDSSITLPMIAEAVRTIGLTVNVQKSEVTRSSASESAPVHFLGHYWINGRMHRPIRELVLRLVFPERWHKQSKARSMARFISMMADAHEMYKLAGQLWPKADTWELFSHMLDEMDSGADESYTLDPRYDLPGRFRHLAMVERAMQDDLSHPGHKILLFGQLA